MTWDPVGREIMLLLLIYTVTGILYTFQSFLMASFAEKLSLELRTKISRKLDRLPLSFFDSHKPGEVLSRATNDLDKMSEVMQTGLLKLFTAVGMVAGSVIMMFRFHIGPYAGFSCIYRAVYGLYQIFCRQDAPLCGQKAAGGQQGDRTGGRIIQRTYRYPGV